jgi:hypothetical protein
MVVGSHQFVITQMYDEQAGRGCDNQRKHELAREQQRTLPDPHQFGGDPAHWSRRPPKA